MSALPPIQIEVALAAAPYRIFLQDGLMGRAGSLLAPVVGRGRVLVVSDDRVWNLHGAQLNAALGGLAQPAAPILLPPGEASKSWRGLTRIAEAAIEAGIGRGDCLIAFGGGVVGDLTGFAASIVKRGCHHIQVPTTLLAQVDSAIGGKNGINTPAGKNLVGTFHQPRAVLIDPDLLATLPPREIRAGYAEIVKYGLIGDADFFSWCERRGAGFLAGDPGARAYAIKASAEAKARIVAEDEKERNGKRMLLNLGHSFAHALEAETGFSEALLHGEAVAIGLVLAFRLSAERGLCPPADAERVTAHLEACGLPTRLDQVEPPPRVRRLVERMRQDKKAEGGQAVLILVRGIGQAFVDRSASFEEIGAFLARESDPA